jgi:pimeloyl-ACP methyl ester carboxylesterase
VLLLPSLGRGVGDFEALMKALADAGFQARARAPRGSGASRGRLQGVTLAVDHPRRVCSVVRLGAGGLVEAEPGARAAFKRFLTEPLAPAERYAAIKAANFASASDASPWLDGWWPDVALAQIEAAKATPHEEWWESGEADVLVVQGLEDRMAPPANGRALAQRLGRRVTLVEVENAGHALLPEQPGPVAAAVIAFLKKSAAR